VLAAAIELAGGADLVDEPGVQGQTRVGVPLDELTANAAGWFRDV
jgi:hypothetical protein